jgi:hypothetical protein
MMPSVYTYHLRGSGKLTVSYISTFPALELQYASYHDGREFKGSFSGEYLNAVPMLALDPDILADAHARKPDIVQVHDGVVKIGWKINVGTKLKDLVFSLQYTIAEGSTEDDQRDRDFIRSLAQRVASLESKLVREQKRNQSLGELIARINTQDPAQLLRLPTYHIRVPTGVSQFPDMYDTNGTHIAARTIESAIASAVSDPTIPDAKLHALIQLPHQLGLTEPIITTAKFDDCLARLFNRFGPYYGHPQLGTRYQWIQWAPFQFEYRASSEDRYVGGSDCKTMSYTTGHIMVLAAACSNPLILRKLTQYARLLDLKASNGLTPSDLLTSIISCTRDNPDPNFVKTRQTLESARAELAQLLRGSRALINPHSAVEAPEDSSDDSELDASDIDIDLDSTLHEARRPPEYKSE